MHRSIMHVAGTARARSAHSAGTTHQPLVKSAHYRLLRFVIPNRSKTEQLIGRQLKQRSHQDIRQSLGVLEIHQSAAQKRRVLRFIRLREQRAACNHAVETRLAQRLSVQIRMRCGS